MKIIKTEYAGKPKGCIQSKTEPETVNGNGVERQKKTYTACTWREPKCNLCFCIHKVFWFYSIMMEYISLEY